MGKDAYHSSGVNIGSRMNIDIAWGNERKYEYMCLQYKKGTKLRKISESHHLFWALPPYLRRVFQNELCDTG